MVPLVIGGYLERTDQRAANEASIAIAEGIAVSTGFAESAERRSNANRLTDEPASAQMSTGSGQRPDPVSISDNRIDLQLGAAIRAGLRRRHVRVICLGLRHWEVDVGAVGPALVPRARGEHALRGALVLTDEPPHVAQT